MVEIAYRQAKNHTPENIEPYAKPHPKEQNCTCLKPENPTTSCVCKKHCPNNPILDTTKCFICFKPGHKKFNCPSIAKPYQPSKPIQTPTIAQTWTQTPPTLKTPADFLFSRPPPTMFINQNQPQQKLIPAQALVALLREHGLTQF